MPKRRKPRRLKAKRRDQIPQKVLYENPTMEFSYDPNALQYFGPLIVTSIAIAENHAKLLQTNNIPIPDPIRCQFLLDTGAEKTVIKEEIALKAGLKLISNNAQVHGVGENQDCKLYFGRIVFASDSKISSDVKHTSWVNTSIIGGHFPQWDKFEGLIGRDVLRFFHFTYNGRNGKFSMQFLKPIP